MRIKFSKRLLSFFLAVLMIVTSVPVAAFTALAAETKTHSFDIKVAEWDFTKGGFDAFSCGNDTYGTVPVKDSVSGLSMQHRVWSTNWTYSNGGAYTGDGYMFYDNMGKYLSDNCGVKISFDIAITNDKSHDYGLFSLGTGHEGNGFWNIINVHSDGAIYYSGATAPAGNVGNLEAKDYSVEINLTPTGALYFICNGTRYNLVTENCPFKPSQLNHLALGVCGDGNYPGIVVKNVQVHKTATVSAENSASAVTAAMTNFENKLADGKVYMNLAPAYEAYVNCQEAIDAVTYGGRTDIDFSYAAAQLNAYTNFMTEWSRQTVNANAAFQIYNGGLSRKDETFSGIAYAENATADASDQTVANKRVYMRHPAVTMLYDGETVLTSPIMLVAVRTGTKTRRFKVSVINNPELELTGHWRGQAKSNSNWDYSSASAQPELVSSTTSVTTMRFTSNNNTGTGLTNVMRFKGSFTQTNGKYTEFLKTIYPTTVTYGNGDDNEVINEPVTNTSKFPIYVVNYKALMDVLVSDDVKNVYKSVASYKEGGLSTFFANVDALTNLDVNTFFSSGNAGAVDLAGAIETAYNNIYDESNRAADSFQTLRDAMSVHKYQNQEDSQTAMEVYKSNGQGFDKTKQSYTDFITSYEAAQQVMADSYTGGYNGDAAALAADLIAKFDAIEIKEIVKPVIQPTATTLGVDNTITITIPADCTGEYTITYSDGSSVTGSLVAGDNTVTPFENKTDVTTASVAAHTVMAGEQSTNTVVKYNLLQAPNFSVNNNDVIRADRQVRLTSANSVATTIQYSYDQTTWTNGTSFYPFVEKPSDIFVTIYAREVYEADGRTAISPVKAVNVIVNAAFDFYLTDVNGNAKSGDHFVSTDKIFLGDAINNYNTPIYYIATVDGVAGTLTPYNKSEGISCSEFNGATIISLTAYAAENQSVRVARGTFYSENYSTLVYAESFDGATTDGTKLTTGSETGINGTGNANTLSILKGYGTAADSNGNTSDYRTNVLKIAAGSSNPGNVVKMDKNPLTTDVNKLVASQNGVTISFWRTFGAEATGSDWLPALSFTDENDKNYYLQIMNTGIISFNQGSNGGVGGSYVDLMPEFQDPTTHTTGNKRNVWIHYAITISPDGKLAIYANGEPHRWAVWTDGGAHKAGDYAHINNSDTTKDVLVDEQLAKDIIAFLTKSTTQFRFTDGGDWNRNYVDTYLDDIRIYTDSLTQAEINNMYNDGDYPDEYNFASVGHDPTAVTVYTLAGGTYTNTDGGTKTQPAGKTVGQEFIDYYQIDVKNPAQVTKIDYYIFGTGMTIYHSNDNVKWEVVGDVQGRTGYQNEQLYGGVYTTAIKEQLDFARHSDGGHTGQWQEPSSGAGYLQWAPHVMYNLNADCWQYYGSTSSWGAMDSCIFTGNSQNITGPYNDIKTVFASCKNTAASTTPGNAIDSCVYYGHNADGTINPNEMYMLYGSWQPTYLIKLDPTTGQYVNFNSNDPYGRDFDASKLEEGYNYYGKVIIDSTFNGGGSGSGEGGFVVYQMQKDESGNNTKGYYYLYISLGSNSGNYQLRMFRSERPDGDFKAFGGQSATDTSATVHGMSFLSSYQLPVYDYVYTSIGHNSVYKAVNNDGKVVTVDSVHARPFSSSSGSNGLVAMQDGAMITRQIDHTGNISIQNMIAYTKDGWQVAFPLQYNGTDTTVNPNREDGKFTPKDLEGVYSFNDHIRNAEYDYARTQELVMLSSSETELVVYTKNVSQHLQLSYGVDYAGDPITYITMEGVGGKYQGVVGQQIRNGRPVIQFSWFQENPNNNHMFTWGYRSAEIPAKDQESSGDFVHNSGVIYTHADSHELGTFSDYGQMISDDPTYSLDGASGERFTEIVLDYPKVINTKDSMSVYCMSDEDFAKDGYTGGSYKAVDMFDSWVIKNADGSYTKITDEDAKTTYKDTAKRVYYLTGYVSNYFHYHTGADCSVDGDTGAAVGYPSYGVRIVVKYVNYENPTSTAREDAGGEYQFFYVSPNPAMAHSIVGIRNQEEDVGNRRKVPVLLYSRFAGSQGNATTIASEALAKQEENAVTDADGKANDAYSLGSATSGIGTFKYISNFGDTMSTGDGDKDYNASTNTDKTWNYTSPDLIAQKFNFRDESEGQNAGSYSVMEFTNNTAKAYYRYTTPVDVNYYVDYSDTTNPIITTANGKPTGYQFNFYSSNLYWNPDANADSIRDMTSYYRNDTGLDVQFSTPKLGSVGNDNNTSIAIDYRATSAGGGTNEALLTHNNDAVLADILRDSNGNLNRAFNAIDNSHGANNDWIGKATFTGKTTVNNNRSDTTNAVTYSNFILEQGLVKYLSNIFGGKWELPYNTYQFYNIGVHTCDKGAVRSFLEKYANKKLDIQRNDAGMISKVTVSTADNSDGSLNVSKYTVASYEEYLKTLSEAYFFLYNEQNTTYNKDANGNYAAANDTTGEYEYVTAYKSAANADDYKPEGTPVYNSTTAGDPNDTNIFGEGIGVVTDPVQTSITDSVIEAAENLYEIEEYKQAKEDYDATVNELIDESKYTKTSVDAYNELINGVAPHFSYSTDESHMGQDDYWRYVELSGSQYADLKNAVDTIKGTLMPKIDTTYLEADIADQSVVRDGGIYDADGNQQYSIGSWDALNSEIKTAEGYVYDAKNPDAETGFIPGQYEVTGTETYTDKSTKKTYTYQTFDETKLSELQTKVDAEEDNPAVEGDGNLNSKKLVEVDTVDAYNNFDAAAEIIAAIDMNKYTPAGQEAIRKHIEQFTGSADNGIKVDGANVNSVYASSDLINTYNTVMSAKSESFVPIDTNARLKNTTVGETDLFTKTLLELTSQNINQYEAYLEIQSSDGTSVTALPTTPTQVKNYGEMFELTVPDIKTEGSVYWSVTVYGDGYDPANSDASVPTSSQKVSANSTATLIRRADADIVVTAVSSDKAVESGYKVVVQDHYGKTSDVKYVSTIDDVAKDGNALTIGSESLAPSTIPFYDFGDWNIDTSKAESDKVITVRPNYTPKGNSSYTAVGGKVSTGASSVPYDTEVTVTADSSLSNFWAWAILKNGKYQIVSYRTNCTFYSVVSQDYVAIVKNTETNADGQTVTTYSTSDGVTLTYENVENSLPLSFYDNGTVKDSLGGVTPTEFLYKKLDAKAPFIYIENTVKNSAYTRAYVRLTQGADSKLTGYGVDIILDGNEMTKPCNNVLPTGQFLVTTRRTYTSIQFRAYVTYDFAYSFNGENYNIAAVDKSEYVTPENA